MLTKTGGGGVGVCVGGDTTMMRGGNGGWSSPDCDAMMMSVTITMSAPAIPAASSGARCRRFGGSLSNIGGVCPDGRGAGGEDGRRGSGLTSTGGRDAAREASGAARLNMPASSAASSPGV